MPWGEPAPINWQARAEKAEAELERIRLLIGMHDPTGADHMEEMMEAVERAEKAEVELRNLKTSIGTSRFKVVSTNSGEEILGDINLDDARLCNELHDGFAVVLAPVIHPETYNLRWVKAVYVRQRVNEWVSYYPPKEEAEFAKWAECNPSIDKIDFAMAMTLGHQLLMEETDNGTNG